MSEWLGKLWHVYLRRPYHLAVPINEGRGQTVVLLHGLVSTHRKWGYVLPHILSDCRVVAMDLLGFGASPKPKHCDYTVQDHARAVIVTLHRKGIYKDIIFVGHSMGALVAVEIAKQKPKMARKLILCGMPIYQFDVARRLLPHQDSFYLRLYQRMVKDERLAWGMVKLSQRLSRVPLEDFGVTRSEIYAAQRSLANTIMNQTTFEDIQKLRVPMYLIGGRLDALVVRRHLESLGKLVQGITLQFVNEAHDITEKYGAYIAEVVDAAVQNREVRPPRTSKPVALRLKSKPASSQPKIEKI